MPLYDYACTQCGRVFEVRHGFDDSHTAPCDACGAPVRRVFKAAPVLFKGSGFYVTDSRGSAASGKPAKPKEEPAAAPGAAKAESSSGSDAKAAPKAAEPAA